MKLVLVKPRLSYEIGPHNFDLLTRLLAPVADGLGPDDIVLLPEHTVVDGSRDHYRDGVSQLARRLGCHVVGGSHHEDRGHDRVNAGAVSDASGQIIGEYEKLRPYADERGRVRSGGALGEVTIGGRRLLVLICADFWFSDVFPRAAVLPDLVLVPAHSVSRKPTPLYSRELWRHLSIARAYELGVYVGVSDWDFTEVPGMLSPSGVSGLADPTTVDPERFFTPVGAAGVQVYELDFARLDAFRADRMARGFFWKKPSEEA